MKVKLCDYTPPKTVSVNDVPLGALGVVVECPAHPEGVGDIVVGIRGDLVQIVGSEQRYSCFDTKIRLLEPGEKIEVL